MHALVRPVTAALAALLAAAPLAGCSSGGGGGSTGQGADSSFSLPSASRSSEPTGLATNTVPRRAPDACQLVSRAEAAAALGVAVSAGTSTPDSEPSLGYVGSCTFRPADVKAHPTTALYIYVLGTTVLQQSFERQLKQKAPDATPVTGLGDEAATAPGILFVYDKGAVIVLQASNEGKPVADAKLRKLAGQAVSHAGILR